MCGDNLTNIKTHQSFVWQTILDLLAPVAVQLSTFVILLSVVFYNVSKPTAQQKKKKQTLLTYAELLATAVADVSKMAGAIEAPNQVITMTTRTADVDVSVIETFVVI